MSSHQEACPSVIRAWSNLLFKLLFVIRCRPARFVVLAFDSKEKAQGWADAADIKAINAIRTKTTNSSAFIVEGFAKSVGGLAIRKSFRNAV